MTHEERLNLALEFNKKFIANNYISKTNADEILLKTDLTQEEIFSGIEDIRNSVLF